MSPNSKPGNLASPSVDITHIEFSAVCRILAECFDTNYYIDRYPDMALGKVNPLEHYAIFGWKENRDPCFWFSTKRYLAANPDVVAMDVNPLLHYILQGHHEGRAIWCADFNGPVDLKIDPTSTCVTDQNLRLLVKYPPRPLRPPLTGRRKDHLTLHWLIPDFSKGSGGHMTIFRMVQWLEIFGHKCKIWINYPEQHTEINAAYDDIVKYYKPIRAEVAFADDGIDSATGDVIIATSWETVARALHAVNFRERCYFVQDYEPSFYPVGSHTLIADWTYSQELGCICAGPWLARRLRRQFRTWVRYFNLAYDPAIYRPRGTEQRQNCRRPLRIALYARAGTPRRAVELVLLGLEHLATSVKFHVDLFGSDHSYIQAPFSCTSHGILNPNELAELYHTDDIGICFSSTNYSLVPQEMMACELPVVEINGDSTRTVFPPEVVTFTGPHPLTIARDIGVLLKNPTRRTRQAAAALRWVSRLNWEKSARSVENALFASIKRREKAPQKKPSHDLRSMRVTHPVSKRSAADLPMTASVCIPTYNGGELLIRVVERVLSQRTPWQFEIVIVDSDSSDGSIQRIRSLCCSRSSPIRLHVIPKEEFQHGRTRNLCASMASGNFLAFLTQDSLPVDELWLYGLITVLNRFPRAAGAFGRHFAWPDASPFSKRDISKHFSSLDQYPIGLSRDTSPTQYKPSDERWRQILHYFSNNNSCLRRSVWEHVPFPEVVYGEDQAWADRVIRLGYEKIYVPTAAVYHSHDYTTEEASQRAEQEAFFFTTAFGYRTYDLDCSFEDQLMQLDEADKRWAKVKGLNGLSLEHRLSLNRAILAGRAAGTRMALQSTQKVA